MLPSAITFLFMVSMVTSHAAPSVLNFSGKYDEVLKFAPIKVPMIATVTSTGGCYFTLHYEYASGYQESFKGLPDRGTWIGTGFLDAGKDHPIVKMSVEGCGEGWTLKIAPLSSAPIVKTKDIIEAGSKVIKFAKPTTSVKKVKIIFYGGGYFKVSPISPKGVEGTSMASLVGSIDRTVLMPSGTQYLAIISESLWEIVIK
jgi:hypothetical protein